MGKTTLCKRKGGFYDADWGYFRVAFGESENTIRGYCKIASYNAKEGFICLCNEPSLMPRIKQQATSVVCVLPKDSSDVAVRVQQREDEHPVNKKFADEYVRNWVKWKEDWRKRALALSIPVVEVDGLSEDWGEICNVIQNCKF